MKANGVRDRFFHAAISTPATFSQAWHYPFSHCFPRQQVSFRPYSLLDRPNVIGIINAVGQERQYLQSDRYTPTPDWETALRGEGFSSNHLLFVLEKHSQIIGFIRLYPENCPGRQPIHDGWVGDVGIVLLPPYRSYGIGKAALSQLIEVARFTRCRQLNAQIFAENIHSLRLFAGQRFQEIARSKRRVNYLPDLVDEIVVSLIMD